ncbi:MAG: DUF362 domain-containing protein [Firmicutes bacterium]|nr:DUF362 domain-containing protein [Bacillota bacterium]
MSDGINRRDLLIKAAALGLSVAGIELLSNTDLLRMVETAEAAGKPVVAVASKGSVTSMVVKVVDKLGGMSRFVKKGAKVVIKPNIGWARNPEQAANTNPQVVETLISLCKKAGASSVSIYEFACDSSVMTFRDSGIGEVCTRTSVPLISAHESKYYTKYSVPRGKILKQVDAVKAIMEADCFINVPVVKVHGGSGVSLAMKNHMGSILDRGEFHRKGLHQCIADLATIMRPHLNVADASRVLLTHGPKGPGQVRKDNKIFASTDIVAIDACGAKLLGFEPMRVDHIRMATEMGIGQGDLAKVSVIEV